MSNKKLILIITLSFIFNEYVFSQKKSINIFSKTKKENTLSKKQNIKEDYQYKSYFYSAVKHKSLQNFDKAIINFERCIKINNTESAPYYQISKIYFYLEDYYTSIEFIKEAIRLDPVNKWYLEFYTEILLATYDFSEAIKVFKKLINIDNKNEEYYISLAVSYTMNNNLKAAVSVYDNLEEIKGVTIIISKAKYQLYIEQKNFKLAAKELENLLKEFPNNIEAYELLSDCYLLSNNYDKALETLKNLSKIEAYQGNVNFRLSDLYLKQGDKENHINQLMLGFSSKELSIELKIRKMLFLIESHLNKDQYNFEMLLMCCQQIIETNPESDAAHYIYADLLKSNKDFSNSEIHYKKSLEINPNHQTIWINLLILNLDTKDYQDLITQSKLALDLFPTNSTIYYLQSLAYYNLKEYPESIESINMGINFTGNNISLLSEMYGLLGNIYNATSQYLESDQAYEKSLEYLPTNVISLNNYAYYLSLRGENLKKAEIMSRKTIDLFPEEGNYYDTYAWVLYKMKNYLEAKKYILISIEKGQAKNPVVIQHLSDILFELGEIEEAEKYKKQAIELRLKDND
tara:strand:- start:142 stop:1866 length:1725 start_codon:yes stop_codon:yes gene_type:complete